MRRVVPLLVLLAALGGRGLVELPAQPRQGSGGAAALPGLRGRPISSPSRGAYEAEIEALERALRGGARPRPRRRPARASSSPSRCSDFERASARGRAIRDAGGDLAEREAALADVRTEQARRRVDPTQVFLHRLLTF